MLSTLKTNLGYLLSQLKEILNFLEVCGFSKLKAELGLHQGMQ